MHIKKISQFISALSKVKGSHLFYRGHSDKNYKLVPNLYRKENFYISEDEIYREAIINNPHEFYNCRTTIEILVKMQHYGIPTRLMDVTRNPLVSLYFACATNEDTDGEVIILDIPYNSVRFYDSDKVTILANIAKQQVDFGFDYSPDFDYFKKKDVKYVNKHFFGYLLHSIRDDKPHFFDIINPLDLERVLAVQVKLDNPRIIRQDGAFLIFGIKKNANGGKDDHANIDQKWIQKPGNRKVIIPKESKKDILNELDTLGINRKTLFPELDDFANYIKNKYTPS